MSYFELHFKETPNEQGEMTVLCPFHDDTKPSAHINVEKGVFHCKVCHGENGLSEAGFLAQLEGISYSLAVQKISKLTSVTSKNRDWTPNQENLLNNFEQILKIMDTLKISEKTIEQYRLGYMDKGLVSIPIFMFGELVNVKNYFPNGDPKWTNEKGSFHSIFPYDDWLANQSQITLLCAGEKDALASLEKGLNAISFTGGEGSFPKLFASSFKGKKVYIAYDNDKAGLEGAAQVAMHLKDAGATPFIVTGHLDGMQEKEDIFDFFNKYGKSKQDLLSILQNTPEFSEEDYHKERVKHVPLVSLNHALENNMFQSIASNIQVVATYDQHFEVPTYVTFTKTRSNETASQNLMSIGEVREWALSDENLRDALYLFDEGVKEEQRNKKLQQMAGVPAKEYGVRMAIRSRSIFQKAVVTDDSEAGTEQSNFKELVMYSSSPLDSNHKYRIEYKLVAHPNKALSLVGMLLKYEASEGEVGNFKVDEKVKDHLRLFQASSEKGLKKKLDEIYQMAKGFTGAETNKDIFLTGEMSFHTPEWFVAHGEKHKAYLDVFIVGETRTGKSKTLKKMLEMYTKGVFASLKTSTTQGLIGGSDKIGGSYKTKIGMLPRNHKSLVVLEEFSGAKPDFISTMTDIRSSGKVNIVRVNGSLTVDCRLRMVTISNQKAMDGVTKPLTSYAYGIQVLQELIGASEDIARYDFFTFVDRPKEFIKPQELPHYSEEAYKDRLYWVWSRKAEQVQFTEGTLDFIIDKGIKLDEKYHTPYNFFGTEAWIKLARMSIAIASIVCSTDETFENIIVKPEHVQYASEFFKSRYDNDLFNLGRFCEKIRAENEVTPESLRLLENYYQNHTMIIQYLEENPVINQRNLESISGMKNEDLRTVLNRLAQFRFISMKGRDLVTTQAFMTALKTVKAKGNKPISLEDFL